MSRIDYGALASLEMRWQQAPEIPRWKKDGMIALLNKLKHKAADNHNSLSGVELYYPEDCHNYDVFITVAYALDAFVVPTSGDGCIMRNFAKHPKDFEIE